MKIEEFKSENFIISTDKQKLDIKTIHEFLTNSYWSKGVSVEKIIRSIEHSLCFGLYDNNKQIGFARVVTDYTFFAYLADVFIIDEYRGQGLSKWLMKCILGHAEVNELRSWMLSTKDAHGLYEKFGFKPLEESTKYMGKKNLNFK